MEEERNIWCGGRGTRKENRRGSSRVIFPSRSFRHMRKTIIKKIEKSDIQGAKSLNSLCDNMLDQVTDPLNNRLGEVSRLFLSGFS